MDKLTPLFIALTAIAILLAGRSSAGHVYRHAQEQRSAWKPSPRK